MKGIFVTATDTNVGKTWIGSHLIHALKNRLTLQVRKPVESGWPTQTEAIQTTDAWILANAADQTSMLSDICPYRFTAALSPDRAAHLENTPLTLAQLKKACLANLEKSDFLYVEGAGGLYSPLCDDGLNADLANALCLPLLLVVENRLGCINQTLLNVEAITHRGLRLQAIVLNDTNGNEPSNSDEMAMDNLSDIQRRVNHDVIAFKHGCGNEASLTRLLSSVLDQ